MNQSKEQIEAEIRYAQRLCERTARLYRRAATFMTFLSVLAGSAALVAVSAQLPQSAILVCALLFAVVIAANTAIRPTDKAAQNEMDVRKYADLLVKAKQVDQPELLRLLAEARKTDVPEIEPLRPVAFNDVMAEIHREDQAIPLNRMARLLKLFA